MCTTVAAAEWGLYGIRANCTVVGLIASEQAVEAWRASKIDAAETGASTALGRPGASEEMAKALVLSAGDAASMRGQVLALDGPRLGISNG